jgi:hypothetical protein
MTEKSPLEDGTPIEKALHIAKTEWNGTSRFQTKLRDPDVQLVTMVENNYGWLAFVSIDVLAEGEQSLLSKLYRISYNRETRKGLVEVFDRAFFFQIDLSN